jgi:stearoyl-CoA desaturase (delta-9 desaturase)
MDIEGESCDCCPSDNLLTFRVILAIVSPCPVSQHSNSADIVYPSAIPFVLVHVGCLAALWTGITWPAVWLGIALYWLRMFAVTAGYHRYFSHRAFATGRVFQFVLAFLAQSSAQRSVLWWGAKHRHHHLHSDTPTDVHSPRHEGFLYSHVGWIFARTHARSDIGQIPDFARYPELRLLHRFELAPAVILAAVCFLLAGWPGLVVGFLWSTVLVYHGTFSINSLAHVRGSTRYVTGDDSRNNFLLAVITMGEGWHNNHHAYPSSTRQGFRAWEIDVTFYVLRLLALLGIVRGLKAPPQRVLRGEHELGTRVIERAAEQLAASFSHLPKLPGRASLAAQASAMFAKTPSLDAIVDRAHVLLAEPKDVASSSVA